jgi:hypothetical protein
VPAGLLLPDFPVPTKKKVAPPEREHEGLLRAVQSCVDRADIENIHQTSSYSHFFFKKHGRQGFF